MMSVMTDIQWIKVNDLLNKKTTLQKVVKGNRAVEMSWFPFSGVSKWEAFEAFMDGEVDCGDWDPQEDEVWLRIMNIPKKVGWCAESQIYMGRLKCVSSQFPLLSMYVVYLASSGGIRKTTLLWLCWLPPPPSPIFTSLATYMYLVNVCIRYV